MRPVTLVPPLKPGEIADFEAFHTQVRRTESGADGVYLWPRAEHWNAKPKPWQPKPWRYVAYRGHSGTESGSCDER